VHYSPMTHLRPCGKPFCINEATNLVYPRGSSSGSSSNSKSITDYSGQSSHVELRRQSAVGTTTHTMIVKPKLEFAGGTPETTLLTVEAHQICVSAYHPNRSQLRELARAADLVADSMGTDELPNLGLVHALQEKTALEVIATHLGKETEHVERN
jgi:hypothetical protein